MPMLPPNLFVAFMRNTLTGETFMAPAIGQTQTQAEDMLRETYPSAAYSLNLMYPAQDIQKYMGELERWPGLPSKVQPKLTDLLANQRIRSQMGGLPPLRKAEPAPQPATLEGLASPFTREQVEHIRTIAKGMPTDTQALAARLLAGGMKAAQPMVQAASAQVKTGPAMSPAAGRSSELSARIEVSSAPTMGHSLKDALNAMRGISQPSTPIATKAPVTEGISRLPASARGVQTEADSTPEASPFAVGKVSAISVLKALRTGR